MKIYAMNSTINKSEETLKVFVRVRPPIYKEVKLENAVSAMGGNSVIVNHEGKDTSCTYHHVFNELTEQEQIFEKIKPVLVDTLAGINSCIFAYGQTSSGTGSHNELRKFLHLFFNYEQANPIL